MTLVPSNAYLGPCAFPTASSMRSGSACRSMRWWASRSSGTSARASRGAATIWACCPFHGEKTPSFHADDRKGIYHCFGCGVTGDHFRFLTEKAGMSFPEAVEKLAGHGGRADAGARRARRGARGSPALALRRDGGRGEVFRGGAGAQYRGAGARLSVRARRERRRRRRGSASALRPTAATGSRSTSRRTASRRRRWSTPGWWSSREDDRADL